MTHYLLRRIAQAAVTLLVVVTVTFVLGRLSGSPGVILLGDNATPEQIDAFDAARGFDRPIWEQFLGYLGGVAVGDFGESYRQTGTSSMQLALERLPASLTLGAVGLGLGIVLAVLATLAIQVTGSRTLRAVSVALGSLRAAVPDFFFGLLLVLVFSIGLGWLPSLGNQQPAAIVLPAVTVGTGVYILYTRLLDNAMNEQLGMDYVKTALARGDSRLRVTVAEVLPNALLPVLTVAGINVGAVLGGMLIVENVFAWPGLGQLTMNAVYGRDFPVVQASILVVAALFVVTNLVVDLVYMLIDPRVRLS
ncbi:ABC transporter permease [Cellulomonas sp. NPDC057328]|uniref:ABC transporter permease n=1 Tax=Cellulomonas sp. NPDC057328 TaxID=3346101 RepID=UPI003644C422